MENAKYKSNDFYTTAICIASGAKLLAIEKTPKQFVNFLLDISSVQAGKIIKKHWDRDLVLPTRDIVEAINQLKTRLHNGV